MPNFLYEPRLRRFSETTAVENSAPVLRETVTLYFAVYKTATDNLLSWVVERHKQPPRNRGRCSGKRRPLTFVAGYLSHHALLQQARRRNLPSFAGVGTFHKKVYRLMNKQKSDAAGHASLFRVGGSLSKTTASVGSYITAWVTK